MPPAVITAYALGVVVGAPIIATLTGPLPRDGYCLAHLAVVVGNGLSALAQTYDTLLIFRFIAGFPHGAFSVAGLSSASMAPITQRGRAVAFITINLFATVAVYRLLNCLVQPWVGIPPTPLWHSLG